MQYPKHIAIIPDGNRTRAKAKGLAGFFGHLEGFNQMIKLTKHIFTKTPIQVFTLRGLSTENLQNRTTEELSYLFDLYKEITEQLYELFHKHKINFRTVGDLSQLPPDLQTFLQEKKTEFNFESERVFVLAINYGGQDEILRAVQCLITSGEEVSAANLEKYMDFGGLPPVELVIRTKQELAQRLSGFMLWRIGYAQLYFTNLYCPDFDVTALQKALERYDNSIKNQNFGK